MENVDIHSLQPTLALVPSSDYQKRIFHERMNVERFTTGHEKTSDRSLLDVCDAGLSGQPSSEKEEKEAQGFFERFSLRFELRALVPIDFRNFSSFPLNKAKLPRA